MHDVYDFIPLALAEMLPMIIGGPFEKFNSSNDLSQMRSGYGFHT